MSGAINVETARCDASTAFFHLQCPEVGAYRGYKKVGKFIVSLEIPVDALRLSGTSRLCRTNKATVVEITTLDGQLTVYQAASEYEPDVIYKTGESIEIPDFDTNRWDDRANRITHFLTRAEAVRY